MIEGVLNLVRYLCISSTQMYLRHVHGDDGIIILSCLNYFFCFASCPQLDTAVDLDVIEFCDSHGKIMEKSWHFVAKISWQPCQIVDPLVHKYETRNRTILGRVVH